MGVEVDALDWSGVSLVDLDDVLGAQVVELDLLVVGAGGDGVAEGVELDLVDHPVVLLVGLDRLLRVEVPDVDHLVVAGHHISCRGTKLAVPHPVAVLLQRILQPPVHRRPNLHQLVVPARRQQQPVAGEVHPPDTRVVRFYQRHLLCLCLEVHLPELEGLVAGGRHQQRPVGAELEVMDLVLPWARGTL